MYSISGMSYFRMLLCKNFNDIAGSTHPTQCCWLQHRMKASCIRRTFISYSMVRRSSILAVAYPNIMLI